MATMQEILAARAADRQRREAVAALRAARDADRPSIRTPDGRSTAPGTGAAQAERIPEGMVFDPKTGGYVDATLAAARMGPAQGAGATFISGAPFVGEFADEAMGRVMTPRNPEIGQEIMRQSQAQFAENHPIISPVTKVAGGIVGSLPAAALAPAVAPAVPASLAGRVAAGAGVGGVVGAIEGAVSGAGRGRNNAERRSNAMRDGIVGGAGGAAFGAAAPAIASGFRAALNRIKGSDVRTIASELGVEPRAATLIKRALDSDDMDAAEAALRAGGSDRMLADAGEATGELLDAAMASGGRATRVGRDAVRTRVSQMQPQVVAALDDALGPPSGVRATSRRIARRTAESRKAAYDAAYGTPIDYADDTGRAIEGVLSRIPNRTLRSAVDEANDAMQVAGLRNQQIMAEIAEDGSVSFREMPNVQQLDYIKRALGSAAQNETDAVTGRISSAGLNAQTLARDLRQAMGEAVPLYREAVQMGGDKIAEDTALDLGRKLFSSAQTRETVADAMFDASDAQRDAFRQGLRQSIDDLMARAKGTALSDGTEAREVLDAMKAISSRSTRDKIVSALGEDEAARIIDAVDQASAAIALNARTARGSQTAIRGAIREGVKETGSPGVARTIGRGEPVGASQRIVQALTGNTPEDDSFRNEEVMAQIAEALTQIRGRRADRALAAVRRAMEGQPMRDAQAREVSNLIGGSVALGGYQSATQALEAR